MDMKSGATNNDAIVDLSEIPGLKNKVLNRFFQNQRDSDTPHPCYFGYPNGCCNQDAIISHVFSRSLLKEYIAKNSQVYMPDGGFSTLKKTAGRISYKLVGVNKATTFYGFCQQHDSQIFADIDTDNWLPTEKQLVLAYFRALCYELHQKHRAYSNMEILHEMLSEEAGVRSDQASTLFRSSASAHEISFRDNFPEFMDLQKAIVEQNFTDHLNYASWTTESRLPMACFGLFNPIHDAAGDLIQDPFNLSKRFENTFVAVVPRSDSSRISIASLKGSAKSLQFIKSLLDTKNDQIADIVAKTIFANSENQCFNPTWFDRLPPRIRKVALKQMQQMISMDMPYPKTPKLIDDIAILEASNIEP